MNRRDALKLSAATAIAAGLPRARGMIGLLGGGVAAAAAINPMATNYAAGGTGSLSYEALPLFKNIMRSGRGFTQPQATITGITQATQAVVTINSTINPFIVGEGIPISGVAGMTQINGLTGTVQSIGGSSGAWALTLNINSSAFSAYTSGGTAGALGTQVPLTNQGWPAADCGVVLGEGANPASWTTLATVSTPMKCGFIGTGLESISLTAYGNCTVANVVHGTGGAYTTFDLYGIASAGGWGFQINNSTLPISGISQATQAVVTINSANATNPYWVGAQVWISGVSGMTQINNQRATVQAIGGTSGAWTITLNINSSAYTAYTSAGVITAVSDVFAYHPSYPGSAIDDVTQTSAYIPETITKYAAMAGIRPMWMSYVTNNTGQNTSTTRHTPSNCQSNQGWFGSTQNVVREAYPAEWMAYFCKACGPQTALYYCLPAWEDGTNGAAGTYSNSLLTMLNSVLIPNGNKIYLEIGNELWNSGSYPIGIGSGETLNTLAVASGIASSNTDYPGVWKYLGYRLHALANMCRTIFGSAFGTQVFIVLADQTGGYNSQACNALNYISANYGAPANDIHYLSCAPYVNLTNPSGDTSIALVLSDLGAQGQVQPYQSKSEHLSILARDQGMKGMLAYEAGWQTNSEPAGNTFIPLAIMDSGMEAVMRDQVWKPMLDSGYDLIFNFESGVNGDGAAYRPVDEWANNESTFISSGSPRYNAEVDLSNGAYTPQRNVLTSRGQVFGATAWADNVGGSAPAPEFNLFQFGYGNCMQINVPAGMAGTYALSLNVTGSASSVTARVNGSNLYTGPLSSGANSLGSVSLVEGKNSFIVYAATSTLTSVNSLTPS